MHAGVDGAFVRDVRTELLPGTSALFVLARGGDVSALAAALEPYRGTLRQTNLDTDAEESLRRALR
jgi:uncharacterized membrane protein